MVCSTVFKDDFDAGRLNCFNRALKTNRIKAAPPRRAVAERRRQKPRIGFCCPFLAVPIARKKLGEKTGARRGGAAFMRFSFSIQFEPDRYLQQHSNKAFSALINEKRTQQ